MSTDNPQLNKVYNELILPKLNALDFQFGRYFNDANQQMQSMWKNLKETITGKTACKERAAMLEIPWSAVTKTLRLAHK